MAPNKLADLIAYNTTVASDLLIGMTYTNQMSDYLDALLNEVKTTANSLEVVAKVSQSVELPHDYIVIFVNKQMQECRN